MKETYRRKRPDGLNFVEAQAEAFKIAFYPMLFQGIRSLISLGVLELIAGHKQTGISRADIASRLELSDYAVSLLLDLAVHADICLLENQLYKPSKLGICLLEDKSVRANIDFMHHVCYNGAFYLEDSFKSGLPEGLKQFGDWETIYQGLAELPSQAQQSWFRFDNHYSDMAFEDAVQIVLQHKPKLVYDIGGNTARFDLILLGADADVRVKIFDLEPQLDKARATLEAAGLLDRADFCAIDLADSSSAVPAGADAIWMSQFLDCFGPAQAVNILNKLVAAMSPGNRLYILEPFIDQQNKIGALALLNTSLYFTCMANGYSRMYNQEDMLLFISEAGLALEKAHQRIGKYNYTLLECEKHHNI